MDGYYEDKLAAENLRRCYEIASARIRHYLDAEVRFVIDHVRGRERILELGCGYGRVLRLVSPHVPRALGNDTSWRSLELARGYLRTCTNVGLLRADAADLAFRSGTFDAVICIQNGISAFGADRRRLVAEAYRVAKDGGVLLFSSYSPRIWADRLAWFRDQTEAGLLGQIDDAETREGTIVGKDGFRATTVGADEFRELFSEVGITPSIHEVDESSLFAVAVKPPPRNPRARRPIRSRSRRGYASRTR